MVSFHCEGTLRVVLQAFKKEFLANLSDTELDRVVCLSIQQHAQKASENEPDDLKEQLLKLLDEQ